VRCSVLTSRSSTRPMAAGRPFHYAFGSIPRSPLCSTLCGKYMDKLTCPNCSENIPFTWGCYLSTSRGVKCSSCGSVATFVLKPRWLKYSSWLVQLSLLGGLVALLAEGSQWAFLAAIVWASAHVIDKKLDSKYGVLVNHRAT